jgi:predicted dehydrogenase
MTENFMQNLSRRDTLKLAVQAGLVAALAPLAVSAAEESTKKIRLGVIGTGDRGTGLLQVALAFPEVEVPALCDINPQHLKHAQDIVEKKLGKRPEGYDKDDHDYRRLVARDDIDAVIIATPQELHVEQAIDSMKAGKFVGSEVPAACTVDECFALVKAAKEFKGRYMMLENYLYSQPNMMVLNMVQQGLFGELTYGFGGYIHEIRSMRFTAKGDLTWRGENVLHTRGIVYPTHAIGPVCRWMGINKDDKLQTLVAMDSKPLSNQIWAAQKFGKDSSQAKIQFENGDTNQCLIRTANGRLIEVRYDTASPRPPGMGQYSLQGTKASFESALGERKIYFEGKSPKEQWEDLAKYEPEYNHPYWAKRGDEAKKSGHGGGDYFVISDFLESVRTGESKVDAIDAATWSCVRPLSEKSIREGNKPQEIPDFTKV